jgi:hypothetical protein
MAIDSLTTVLPRWHAWAEKAHSLKILKAATYPFPSITPKFLGIIVQKYRPRGQAPAAGFQNWIDEIKKSVHSKLAPALRDVEMMLPNSVYEEYEAGAGVGFCLATIPDFNTLIAKSQKAQTAVFALTSEQIGQVGMVLKTTKKSRDNFKKIFSELADKIIGLTNDAGSD